jgi:membrane protein DedA with SNARE-associated domain
MRIAGAGYATSSRGPAAGQAAVRRRSIPYRRVHALVMASITDPVVDFAVGVVRDLGLPGVFLLMVFESACIPIPSEATMLFAGFNVSNGEYTLIAATLVGASANLVGSWIAYAVGYYGRVDILEKHGRKLHIKPSQLQAADRYFEKHGDVTVFFTRMLPIIRTFISLPAGVARMPIVRFSVLTFLGCLPWVFMLTFIGKQVGDNWVKWKDSLHYVDYAIVALIVVGIVYLVVRYRRGGGSDSTVGSGEPAADAAGN